MNLNTHSHTHTYTEPHSLARSFLFTRTPPNSHIKRDQFPDGLVSRLIFPFVPVIDVKLKPSAGLHVSHSSLGVKVVTIDAAQRGDSRCIRRGGGAALRVEVVSS